MRIFYLYLIFNIIFCYAVVCNSSVTFAASSDGTKERCHQMDHGNSVVNNSKLEHNNEANSELSCCSEILTNKTFDQYVKTYYRDLPRSSVQYFKVNSQDKPVYKRSQSEHDPPDLLILNASFLI